MFCTCRLQNFMWLFGNKKVRGCAPFLPTCRFCSLYLHKMQLFSKTNDPKFEGLYTATNRVKIRKYFCDTLWYCIQLTTCKEKHPSTLYQNLNVCMWLELFHSYLTDCHKIWHGYVQTQPTFIPQKNFFNSNWFFWRGVMQVFTYIGNKK